MKGMKGLIHVYTGDGKGKTTAAIGLGVRASGRGLKVLMVQFLKGTPTGELFSLKLLEPGFELYRGKELKKFTWEMSQEEKVQTAAEQQELFQYAKTAALRGGTDLLILDEALGAITTGMLSKADVLEFVQNKPESLELVLTGRNAPAELTELADYVSEIRAVKHPAEKGIMGRKGIEF
jgi:cob(I)alamin adenosyltransferase